MNIFLLVSILIGGEETKDSTSDFPKEASRRALAVPQAKKKTNEWSFGKYCSSPVR